MFRQPISSSARALTAALTFLAGTWGPLAPLAQAQEPLAPPQAPESLTFRVSGPSEKLELVVNSSRVVEMDFKVPRLLVENPGVVKAVPLSPTQVQVAAQKPGVTHISLWDEEGQVHSLDVIVLPDARELEYLLKSEFPDASLRVRPLSNAVAISGYVPSAPMVTRIVAMAQSYFPTVINNIEIGGAQQVLLHVKVMEVSRTKLRALGVDWALFTNELSLVSRPSGLITNAGRDSLAATGQTLAYGVVSGATRFSTFIEAMRKNDLVKVLSEPTLTTVSGRPASFNVGGEFPILVPQSLGTVSVQYRQFGTRVDFVPIVHSNGSIRLEVRPQVSEIDESRGVTLNSTTVPGVRSRWVDTAAEMRAGQTLAIAGLLQNRTESQTKSVPVLGDLPYLGAAFRSVRESNNEVELLILVTPELAEPMDAHEVPPCGPGEFTRSPTDHELYNHGYLEVPRCDGPCGVGRQGAPQGHPGMISQGAPAAPVYQAPHMAPAPVQSFGPIPAPHQQPTPAIDGYDPGQPTPVLPVEPARGAEEVSLPRLAPAYRGAAVEQAPAPVIDAENVPGALRVQWVSQQRNPQSRQLPNGAGRSTGGVAPAGPIGPSGYDKIR